MIENYETWTKSYGGESQVAKDRVIQEMLENFKATGHPTHLCRCFGKRPGTKQDEDGPIKATQPRKKPASSEDKDDPIEFTPPSTTSRVRT